MRVERALWRWKRCCKLIDGQREAAPQAVDVLEGVPHRVDVDEGLQVPCAALPAPLLVLVSVMGPPDREDGPQWGPSPLLPLCLHLLVSVVEGLHHIRAEGTRVGPELGDCWPRRQFQPTRAAPMLTRFWRDLMVVRWSLASGRP